MHRHRFVVAMGATATLLLLVGCTGATGEAPSPTSSATPTGPQTPATTPAAPATTTTAPATPVSPPSADPHPALTGLIISTSGLGPLTVGTAAPATNPGAAMITWDATFCASALEEVAQPGRWVPSGYGNETNYMGESATPFYVDASDAGVHRIDIMGSGPRTAEGIRIGSTLDALRVAYPALAGPFAGPVSRVWRIQDPAGTIVFETQGDADGLRPAGTVESVILIRVLAPGYPAEFAAANSGNVAGACF